MRSFDFQPGDGTRYFIQLFQFSDGINSPNSWEKVE